MSEVSAAGQQSWGSRPGSFTSGGQPASGAVRVEAGRSRIYDAPLATREIDDVETMRVLADPLRIAILRQLMTDAMITPPVMSAKELASTLGEPQTKLYRHLKQLEDVGLIQVAETRMVSGIMEQRYRTGQLSLEISRQLVIDPASRMDVGAGVAAVLDDFRNEFLAQLRAGRIPINTGEPEDPLGLVIAAGSYNRINPAKAAEFRVKVAALAAEFEAFEEEPDGVPVNLCIGWYVLADAPAAGQP